MIPNQPTNLALDNTGLSLKPSQIVHPLTQPQQLCYDIDRDESLEDKKAAETVDWGPLLRGKLYERETEKELLMARFLAITSDDLDQNELVLITGPSGNGKTVLAKSLREPVMERNGFFISGKFDQLQKGESFEAFVCAFTEYVQQVQQTGLKRMQQLRHDTLKAVGVEGHVVLTQMIPSLSILLGEPPDTKVDMMGFEAQQRFQLIFQRFVKAICSFDHPLVLFLDDLQWASKESVDLLASIATDNTVEGLMILGACRGNEVSAEHELSIMLRKMEDSYQLEITDIHVDCLPLEAVENLLQDLFGLRTPGATESVAHLVHDNTAGNPFHTIQLVRALSEEHLLKVTDSGMLTVDYTALHSCYVETGEDIIGLLCSKIERLPNDVQNILRLSSCLGAEFDVDILDRIVDKQNESRLSTVQLLDIADDEGFVTFIHEHANRKRSRYAFVHDRVQQAVYSMIADKPAFHVHVCRRLWNSFATTESLFDNAALVISQLSHGVDLIEDEEERTCAAQLAMHAGKLAMKASSFRTAAAYLSTGRILLGKRPWSGNYDLALSLYTSSAELQYAIGNPQSTDALVNEILENARTLDDKLQAYTIRIYSLGTRHRLKEAIALSLDVLSSLNEPLPKAAGFRHIVLEYVRTSFKLRNKTTDDILKLQKMTDKRKLSSMKILNVVFSFVFVTQPLLAPLYAMKMVQLTLSDGLSPMAAFGFATYSILLLSMGKIVEGCKYTDLAMELLSVFDGQEWVARTYFMAHVFTYTAKNAVSESIDPLLYAHRVGLGSGDCEFAMFSCQFSSLCSIFSSQPLRALYPEMKLYREKIVQFKQTRVLTYHDCQMQFVANMLGESENPSELTGQYMNTEAAIKSACEAGHEALLYGIYAFNMVLCYLTNNLDRAEFWHNSLKRVDERTVMIMAIRFTDFFRGLICLALAEQETSCFRRRKHLAGARRVLRRYQRDIRVSPRNVTHAIRFLEAELEWVVQGNLQTSLRKYEIASELAGNEDALLEQSLSYEKAAKMLRKEGMYEQAIPLLERALEVYSRYGAKLKIDEMRRLLGRG